MKERMQISQNKSNIYISLGSNIDPEDNLFAAAEKLNSVFGEVEYSRVWETPPYNTEGNVFLNAAARFQSADENEVIKYGILRRIETELGRIRTENKFSARTIDLDILVVGMQVIDPELWHLAHLAVPLSELLPTLIDPGTGHSLVEIAGSLMSNKIVPRTDFTLPGNKG